MKSHVCWAITTRCEGRPAGRQQQQDVGVFEVTFSLDKQTEFGYKDTNNPRTLCTTDCMSEASH